MYNPEGQRDTGSSCQTLRQAGFPSGQFHFSIKTQIFNKMGQHSSINKA